MKVLCVVFALFFVGCLAYPPQKCPTYVADYHFDVTSAGTHAWYLNSYYQSDAFVFGCYQKCGTVFIDCCCHGEDSFAYVVGNTVVAHGQLVQTGSVGCYKLSVQTAQGLFYLNMKVLCHEEGLMIVVIHTDCGGGCGSRYSELIMILTLEQDITLSPYFYKYSQIIYTQVGYLGFCYNSQFVKVSQCGCY